MSEKRPQLSGSPGEEAQALRSLELDYELGAPRAEVLVRRLEGLIRSGAIQSGSRLGTKEELRQRFGVAVGTLNEVLRVLDMRGVVEARPGPGGGVFVTQPSPRIRLSHIILDFRGRGINVKDCLTVRNSLELAVALEAGQYRSSRDLRELARLLDEMREHVDDPREFLRRNWAFHQRVAAICRNELLRGLYSSLLDFLEEELDEVSSAETFDPDRTLQLHRQLAAAIEEGSPDRIVRAVRRHTPAVHEELL